MRIIAAFLLLATACSKPVTHHYAQEPVASFHDERGLVTSTTPTTRRASRSRPRTRLVVGGDFWSRLRQCENGGSYEKGNSPRYFGAYQFDRSTWVSNGGNPAEWGSASPAEQDRVALVLYSRRGTQPWPVCARRASS